MALITIAIRITIVKKPIKLNSVCINEIIISAAKEVYIKEEVSCRPRLSGIAKHPYIHAQTTHPMKESYSCLVYIFKIWRFR
jgi:hypothetical protein